MRNQIIFLVVIIFFGVTGYITAAPSSISTTIVEYSEWYFMYSHYDSLLFGGFKNKKICDAVYAEYVKRKRPGFVTECFEVKI